MRQMERYIPSGADPGRSPGCYLPLLSFFRKYLRNGQECWSASRSSSSFLLPEERLLMVVLSCAPASSSWSKTPAGVLVFELAAFRLFTSAAAESAITPSCNTDRRRAGYMAVSLLS